MKTTDPRVTRQALAWALAMTVALYAMLWVGAGAPTVGEASAAPPAAARALVNGGAR